MAELAKQQSSWGDERRTEGCTDERVIMCTHSGNEDTMAWLCHFDAKLAKTHAGVNCFCNHKMKIISGLIWKELPY